MYFKMDGERIAALNQQANREDDLLRHLVIRIDPRIADALISHAQQSVTQAPAPAKQAEGAVAGLATEDVSVATVEAE